MRLPVRYRQWSGAKETDRDIRGYVDTRFPNEDVYLYERQNRVIVEEEKKSYI